MPKLFRLMLLCATFVFILPSCSNEEDEPKVNVSTLNKNSLTMYTGETATLTYSGGTCTWSSDNELIASVSYGVVTAKRVGVTTIRANGNTCKVTVKPRVTKYQEPYIGWGDSMSKVKNSMNSYELLEASSNELIYKVDSNTAYGYLFENDKLETSILIVTSLSEASTLGEFCAERYIPATYVGDYTFAFLTVDKKTAVFVQIATKYIAVMYTSFETSTRGTPMINSLDITRLLDNLIK